MKYTMLITSLCCLLLVSACGQRDIASYAQASLALDIRDYFNGSLTAHGVIFDYTGSATRHFVASIDGSWDGNTGTLDESFQFSDGTTDTRLWTLTFDDAHNFTGTAGDVIGTATGKQYGNALNFHYTLRHEQQDGSTIDLRADDWMYLTQRGVLLNKTTLYKFGIPVAEIVISFTKNDASHAFSAEARQ